MIQENRYLTQRDEGVRHLSSAPVSKQEAGHRQDRAVRKSREWGRQLNGTVETLRKLGLFMVKNANRERK